MKSSDSVKIKVLGSGAADYDWKRFGEEGIRANTSTLINGEVLIDCGITGMKSLSHFGILPDHLSDLIITHSHSDHFEADIIGKIISERTGKIPLHIRASPELIKILRKTLPGKFKGYSLLPGNKFKIDSLLFTALPANHAVTGTEKALQYFIETPHGNILYALDGAWMLKEARQLIDNKKLNIIFWDATMFQAGDWRIFEHNDLDMINLIMKTLKNQKIVDNRTAVILDHISRTLWPENFSIAEKLISNRGWILAFDGMEMELKQKRIKISDWKERFQHH
ncbi:MAG: MBL fold metallo-hydrolase [Victivallaceae bacterium]|nr:MBL fold metallo-hydrolase [Victivallaceae bacterium]